MNAVEVTSLSNSGAVGDFVVQEQLKSDTERDQKGRNLSMGTWQQSLVCMARRSGPQWRCVIAVEGVS